MKILAIDPSLNSTGLAFPDRSTRVIKPPAGVVGPARLVFLRRAVFAVLQELQPNAVALEDYSYGSKGAAVINIGEWGGVLRVLLHELEIPTAFISPASLKMYCTGKGNSKKEVVISELSNLFGKTFRTTDEAEACGLAAMAYDYCGQPWLKMTKDRRKAMDKVDWPEVMRKAARGE